MKRLRIFVLVLLAALLPIRGAVAATMMCPDGEAPSQMTVAAVHEHHDMPAGHWMQHHHASAEASDQDSSSGEHPGNCHFCASGCCMASMVGTVPSLGPPGPTASLDFPALTARVPAFHSGGQDRPPRSI